MKVIILAPLPPPVGGIATWAVRMQNARLKNGWSVHVVDEKLVGRSIHGDHNRKKFFVEAKRCLKIWRELRGALKDPEVKVVHACTPATTTAMLRDAVSAIITHMKKRRYIIHFHCTIPTLMKSGPKLAAFRFLCSRSDFVLTLNRQSSDFVSKNTGTPNRIFPNFAEDSAIRQGRNRKYEKKLERVLYAGGITEEKGCAEIIAAAKSFPDIEFRLVGNVRNDIAKLDIPPNVVLTGAQDQDFVQRELDRADLYIFFTHMISEGFANSLVEAMAAGLPCIVTDWAANADMIEGKGGIVLPAGDVKGLVGAIGRMRDDAALRKEAGSWNIRKVAEQYSEAVVCDRYADLYEQVIR